MNSVLFFPCPNYLQPARYSQSILECSLPFIASPATPRPAPPHPHLFIYSGYLPCSTLFVWDGRRGTVEGTLQIKRMEKGMGREGMFWRSSEKYPVDLRPTWGPYFLPLPWRFFSEKPQGVAWGEGKGHSQLLDELINAALPGVNRDVSHTRPTRNEYHLEVTSGNPSVLQAFQMLVSAVREQGCNPYTFWEEKEIRVRHHFHMSVFPTAHDMAWGVINFTIDLHPWNELFIVILKS